MGILILINRTSMDHKLEKTDDKIIHFVRRHHESYSRVSLFVIFLWFGILKVLGLSPASPLVRALYERVFNTAHGIDEFLIVFGLFEVLIGILFLVRRQERIVLPLLGMHMLTTILPLVVLPALAWTSPFVPTMEGQYIIKNLALIATAATIAANLHSLRKV